MSWTKYGPSEKGCRFYANVLHKLARTRGAPINATERRMANDMAAVFERLMHEQSELSATQKVLATDE